MLLVGLLRTVGERHKASPAQVALAWLLARKPWIVPLFGTRKLERFEGRCQTKQRAKFLALIVLGHEQPILIFQQFTRGHSSDRDDVREVPAVVAQRRGSAGRARDRHLP
jgi:hypothetical protein